MALTIHAPHLPHLEDFARHRTMMIGIAAVSITAATVYVVQQQTNDSTPAVTSSAPAATGSLEFRSGYVLEGTGASGAGAGLAADSASAALPDRGEFLGLETVRAATATGN